MTHIILDQQQAALLAEAGKPLQALDPQGRLVGFIEPAPSDVEIARAKARLAIDEPEFTAGEAIEYLQSLEKR